MRGLFLMVFEIKFVLIKCEHDCIFSHKCFEIFRPFIKESYEFDPYQYTDLEYNPQNYYPHLPTCLMFDVRDEQKNPLGKGSILKNLIFFF